MFRHLLLSLLVMYLSIATHAQIPCTSSLSGRVTDAAGNPLPGAGIVLSPGDIGQATDASGNFAFNNLCPGAYKVTVQYVGYNEVSVRIRISGDDVRTFVLEEAVTELNEVVVQHHDAANTEHATTFVEIGERALSESAGKALGETLKAIPGVTTLQTGPGIFKPVIHGVHSQRLLILNHGIRHEGQQWGAEHAPEIDPFIASNIVVIKDASAIKFGTDALGGVVVVNPAPLPETPGITGTLASVLQSNGRSGTLSGMLEGGIKNHDGWGWRVQGTAKRAGDFHTPDYVLTNTGIEELNVSAAAGYHTRTAGIDLFYSRFQSENGILRGTAISSLDDLVNAMERDEPLYTSDFSYRIQEPRQFVSHNLLKINGHISGGSGEWRIQYAFQNNNRQEYDLRIGNLSRIPAIDLKLNTHTVDAEWETHHSESRTFSIGANGMYQSNRNVPGTQRIPFIPNFDNVSAGVYATAKFFINKWTINTGLRYDFRDYSVKGFDSRNARYDAAFNFSNASAALGITHQVSAEQSLSLNVSTAWRPPHVSELYSAGTHQSAAAIEYGLMLDRETNEVRDFDDVDFEPEQAVKAVASYALHKDGFHLSVTPYANYIADYIYLRPRGVTRTVRGVYPYFRYEQTDALFLGTDVDMAVRLHQYITAKPRLSLLKARDVVNDSYFLYVPSSRYALTLRYEKPELFGLKNAYIESGAEYVSEQKFAPRVVPVRAILDADANGTDPFEGDSSIFDFAPAPDGYTLVDVALGFSIKASKTQYDIRLAAENLFNQRYRDYTNRFRYYADDVGTNVILSIKCIF